MRAAKIKLDTSVTFRCRYEEKVGIKRKLKELGVDQSTYLRALIREALGLPVSGDMDIVNKMHCR